MSIIIILMLLIQLNCETKQRFGDDNWNYENQEEWDLHFLSCNGSHESPINIDSTKVKIDSNLKLQFYNYVHFHKSTAQNNGHTVRVFLHLNDKNQIPYISGVAVNNEKFILDSFHFHWAQNEFNGSEHSINGIKRSAELHLVHWNEIYGNMSNARDREDGLVVVTVFIETKLLRSYGVVHVMAHNPALVTIIDVLPKLRQFGTNVGIKVPINLKALIPTKNELFYKYEGSLTTPPCSPTATFIIFSDPIYMTAKQLSEFQQIEGEPISGSARKLTHNTREQMFLNDRIVKVSNPFVRGNTELIN